MTEGHVEAPGEVTCSRSHAARAQYRPCYQQQRACLSEHAHAERLGTSPPSWEGGIATPIFQTEKLRPREAEAPSPGSREGASTSVANSRSSPLQSAASVSLSASKWIGLVPIPASLAWATSQGGHPARPQPSPHPPGLGKYEETGLPGSIKEITPALLASGLTVQACKRDLWESCYR